MPCELLVWLRPEAGCYSPHCGDRVYLAVAWSASLWPGVIPQLGRGVESTRPQCWPV
jgi:hypothetical protein